MEPHTQSQTRDRILDGAVEAVARYGLTKLAMDAVSGAAGISRATLYRYFSSREELLNALSIREGYRFWNGCLAALRDAPENEERIRLLLLYATRHVREHAALQRMIDTEPAFVLRAVREQFPTIRDELERLIGRVLEETQPVQSGIVAVSQLVDWMTRLLISAFLIPSREPEEMLQGLEGVYRLLTPRPDDASNGDEASRAAG